MFKLSIRTTSSLDFLPQCCSELFPLVRILYNVCYTIYAYEVYIYALQYIIIIRRSQSDM